MSEIAAVDPENEAQGVDDGLVGPDALDRQLVDQLIGQARHRGMKFAWEGGLL